jgi:hypothetical protein
MNAWWYPPIGRSDSRNRPVADVGRREWSGRFAPISGLSRRFQVSGYWKTISPFGPMNEITAHRNPRLRSSERAPHQSGGEHRIASWTVGNLVVRFESDIDCP